MFRVDRRTFLAGVAGFGLTARFARSAGVAVGGADAFGPLEAPDQNGLRLPAGFSSRVVAQSGVRVPGTAHMWHARPDGGATFATGDGGWVYVSNSELENEKGGVGAIRFDAEGKIVDAYSILTDTTRNCAGGATPWGTWLSCEEHPKGRVYECDPFTPGSEGGVRPTLGTFNHEAAATDPIRKTVYLTEDEPDGLLYRFSPDAYPDLSSGLLEVAEIQDPLDEGPITPGQTRALAWHAVPDPNVSLGVSTRAQVPEATRFNGGEGCSYAANSIYFSTKGDDRVWVVDALAGTIGILYDRASSPTPVLSGVDNVLATRSGDVYVAEDPGTLQIVALTPTGAVKPVVQLAGVRGVSELTGPALSPDGTRLYFSSQKNPGTTFEVSGPFASLPPLPGIAGLCLETALGAADALTLRRRRRAKQAG